MRLAKCKVACKMEYDYKPTVPITPNSTALFKYRVNDPLNPSAPYTEYTKSPPPLSGDEVSLPDIQSADQYELKVELNINGAKDEKTFFFQVDKCNLTSCDAPIIKDVYLGANDQIMMDYKVDIDNNFYAVEYQIAKNDQFNNIVHFRIIMENDYTPTEYIEMNDGTIEPDTVYYIRARKHCSTSEVSDWSSVVKFTSGRWSTRKLLDAFWLATSDDLTDKFCDAAGWKTKVTLSADNPEGSLIYLTNGMAATIDNIKDLGQIISIPSKFQESGVRWIRFSNVTPTLIYNVEPTTGKIGVVVDNLKCPAS